MLAQSSSLASSVSECCPEVCNEDLEDEVFPPASPPSPGDRGMCPALSVGNHCHNSSQISVTWHLTPGLVSPTTETMQSSIVASFVGQMLATFSKQSFEVMFLSFSHFLNISSKSRKWLQKQSCNLLKIAHHITTSPPVQNMCLTTHNRSSYNWFTKTAHRSPVNLSWLVPGSHTPVH